MYQAMNPVGINKVFNAFLCNNSQILFELSTLTHMLNMYIEYLYFNYFSIQCIKTV